MQLATFSPTMTSFCILVLLIPTSFCQLALASSSYIGRSPIKSEIGGRETRHTLTKSKFGDATSNNPIPMGIEREIAAIFKGVAYGTTTPLPTISTTASTTTITPSTSTETGGEFIGKQKQVRINVDLVPDSFPFASAETSQDKVKEKINVSSNTAYSYPKEEIEEVDYETFRSKLSAIPKEKPVIKSTDDGSSGNDIQVRVTNMPEKQGYEAIKFHIENAWTLHIYLTGAMFCLVALLCLMMLARINTCSPMLPRGYFVTLCLIIFVASFFRAMLFLHDPYGAHGRLPVVLISILYYSVYPCLNTAFAILMLVILRAARVQVFPTKVQSPLLLGIICGLHVGSGIVVNIASGVLKNANTVIIMRIVTQTIAALWGASLCLIYVFSYNNIEKSAQRQSGEVNHLSIGTNREKTAFQTKSSRPSLKSSSRIFMLCCLLNALLIAFSILDMFTQKVPQKPTSSESWAWLTQSSLERLIEIVLAFLLLISAFSLTKNKTSNNSKDDKIFSLFKNFTRTSAGSKTIDVYPVASEKCNILSNGSLLSASPTSSMNFSINGWKKSTQNKDNFTKAADINTMNDQFNKIIHPNAYDKVNKFSIKTVGRNRMPEPQFCTMYKDQQQWELPKDFQYYPQLKDNIKSLTKFKTEKTTPDPVLNEICNYNANKNIRYPVYCHNDGNVSCSSRSPICRYENDYEVASYYSNSNSSTNTNIYSKPYPFYSRSQYYGHNGIVGQVPQQHLIPVFHHQDSNNPKTENSACSSHSEIQVDYLTDASSTDGLHSSLSRSRTLPMNMQNGCRVNMEAATEMNPSIYAVKSGYRPDITDSRGLSSPLDLLKLSSNSLNDVLKSQSNFFGKIVSAGTNSTGYAPLSLEDGVTPSSHLNMRHSLKRSNSSGNLENDVVGV